MKCVVVAFFLFIGLKGLADGANILGVFHFNGKSHFIMFEALMKGLAAKGHQVTVVSHFPQEKPLPNYKDLSLKGSLGDLVNNVSIPMILEKWIGTKDMFDFIWKTAGVELCDIMFQHPVIQNLIKSNETFDLLITELWGSDCFLSLAHVFKVPHISMISTMEVPWSLVRYGSPYNPAYQTSHFTAFSPRGMNFLERVVNTLLTLYMNVGYSLYSEGPTDKIVRKYLGDDVPPLREIVYNSSLLLVNSHFSVVGSRPLAPNVIEVGGLHIPDPKPLPAELEHFLDDATEGVIVFSLGSLIQSETFDESKLQGFINVFRRIPQKVLWKFGGTIKNKPDNLKIMKWLPQGDVLRHPNVKAFITHGGLMGTQEAIHAGVPMIGIPFFADQRFNIRNYKEMGFALDLELDDISEVNVENRIKNILNNPSYNEKAKLYSTLFKDRPQSALNTSIFWTEYVIRHKGAKHLLSAARELPWYQYYLLDVLSFVLLGLTFIFFILYKLLKKCLAILLCRSNKASFNKYDKSKRN